MTNRKRRSDSEWQSLIDQQLKSGLSAFAFCQQQSLSCKTFYKRRQKLQQKSTLAAKPNRFIKIKPNSGSAKLTVSTVVLHHQNSRLQLGPDTDALWLAKLMKALA